MPLDYTLGPISYQQNGGALVRLGDDYRKAVVFIGSENAEDIIPAGTGFFVWHGEGRAAEAYLVTAGHVARGLDGAPIGIRFNTRDNRFRVEPVDMPEWRYHPDENVDVAVMQFTPPRWADCKAFPSIHFATPQKMESKDFGTGDLAYVVGLFRLLKDTKRNLPVVYTGHIALNPQDEEIPWRDTQQKITRRTRAYLVEAGAISGASGAPVFVRRTVECLVPDPQAPQKLLRAWGHGSVWLLGLWSSSWPGTPENDLADAFGLPKDVKVPIGVGVVVPAERLLETLNLPQLKAQRQKNADAEDQASAPTTDAAPVSDNPTHKEDFTNLLRAAVKGPKRGPKT